MYCVELVSHSEAKLAAACSGLAYVVCYLPYTTISQSDGTAGNIGKTIVVRGLIIFAQNCI